MLRAVIFDFDGVITDSEILHFRAFNAVLGRLGVELTTQDYYKMYLGLTDIDCFRMLIRQGLLKIDQGRIPDLLHKKKVVFEELAKTEGRLIEGARDCIGMLAENRIPMAICSGSLLPEIEVVLEDAKLREFFEVIVSAEYIRAGKPNPEGMLLTLKRLNENRREAIHSGECVVIEDSSWGLEAAKAAGMHTVGVTNSYDAAQLGLAEKIVGNLAELRISDLQELCA
jgi:beta-phosphoglucomutase